MRDELKELKTAPADLRRFGLLVGGVFTLIGIWLWFRHRESFLFFLIPGLVLIFAGLLFPSGLRLAYLLWMGTGLALGVVVGKILLTLFFFLVVTPTAWIAKASGKEFLNTNMDQAGKSYWLSRPRRQESPADYEKQF